jgi:hypothetical protein
MPGALTSRRMFLNHVGFFNILDKSKSDYFWYSGSHHSVLVSNKYFSKIPFLPNMSGNAILINNRIIFDLNDLQSVYLVSKRYTDNVSHDDLNFDMLFNFTMSLDLIKNYYTLVLYTYIYKFYSEIIIRFF